MRPKKEDKFTGKMSDNDDITMKNVMVKTLIAGKSGVRT